MLDHSADNSHHQPGCPPSESSSSTPSGASASIARVVQRRARAGDDGDELGVRRRARRGRRRASARPRPRRRSPRRRSRPRRRPRSARRRRRARPARRRRCAGAASTSSIAAAFSAAVRARRERDRRGQAGLLGAGRHDDDVLLGQLGGALGRHAHVRAVGQDDDLLGGHLVDAGEELVRGGVERRAAVEDVRAERREQRRAGPAPETTASAPRALRAGRARRPPGARRARRPARACRRRRDCETAPRRRRRRRSPARGRRCGRGPSACCGRRRRGPSRRAPRARATNALRVEAARR